MVDLVCVIRFNELPLSLALSLIHYAIAGVGPDFGVGLSAYEVSRAEVGAMESEGTDAGAMLAATC